MKSQTLLKTSNRALAIVVLCCSCGVKGPPEPPLANEASVKKTPLPESVSSPSVAPSPVIFPVKVDDKKNKKKVSAPSDKKGP